MRIANQYMFQYLNINFPQESNFDLDKLIQYKNEFQKDFQIKSQSNELSDLLSDGLSINVNMTQANDWLSKQLMCGEIITQFISYLTIIQNIRFEFGYIVCNTQQINLPARKLIKKNKINEYNKSNPLFLLCDSRYNYITILIQFGNKWILVIVNLKAKKGQILDFGIDNSMAIAEKQTKIQEFVVHLNDKFQKVEWKYQLFNDQKNESDCSLSILYFLFEYMTGSGNIKFDQEGFAAMQNINSSEIDFEKFKLNLQWVFFQLKIDNQIPLLKSLKQNGRSKKHLLNQFVEQQIIQLQYVTESETELDEQKNQSTNNQVQNQITNNPDEIQSTINQEKEVMRISNLMQLQLITENENELDEQKNQLTIDQVQNQFTNNQDEIQSTINQEKEVRRLGKRLVEIFSRNNIDSSPINSNRAQKLLARLTNNQDSNPQFTFNNHDQNATSNNTDEKTYPIVIINKITKKESNRKQQEKIEKKNIMPSSNNLDDIQSTINDNQDQLSNNQIQDQCAVIIDQITNIENNRKYQEKKKKYKNKFTPIPSPSIEKNKIIIFSSDEQEDNTFNNFNQNQGSRDINIRLKRSEKPQIRSKNINKSQNAYQTIDSEKNYATEQEINDIKQKFKKQQLPNQRNPQIQYEDQSTLMQKMFSNMDKEMKDLRQQSLKINNNLKQLVKENKFINYKLEYSSPQHQRNILTLENSPMANQNQFAYQQHNYHYNSQQKNYERSKMISLTPMKQRQQEHIGVLGSSVQYDQIFDKIKSIKTEIKGKMEKRRII